MSFRITTGWVMQRMSYWLDDALRDLRYVVWGFRLHGDAFRSHRPSWGCLVEQQRVAELGTPSIRLSGLQTCAATNPSSGKGPKATGDEAMASGRNAIERIGRPTKRSSGGTASGNHKLHQVPLPTRGSASLIGLGFVLRPQRSLAWTYHLYRCAPAKFSMLSTSRCCIFTPAEGSDDRF
jgi:hypothetical protein